MMIFSLVAMTGLEKCCITSAYLQWLCHSGERPVAHGPLVSTFFFAKCLCVGEDGPGRGHLCHTNTFLVQLRRRLQCVLFDILNKNFIAQIAENTFILHWKKSQNGSTGRN